VSAPTAPTALVTHRDCGRHDTGWGHPEHMGRLPAIVQALYRDTPALLDVVLQHEADPATDAQLLRVHTPALIETVRSAAAEAGRTGELVRIEADTIVSPASWDAAVGAVGCAVDAVSMVMAGRARTAFALCRPPGHHATRERAMGFCLFNNVAVAARAAQAEHGIERILVIDWDVHHGNGTQDIFYDDPRVHYVSFHIDGHYPGTGAATETGTGAGAHCTLNVPLPPGTGPAEYHRVFEDTLDTMFAACDPQLVIVSAGYDCLAGDPLGGMLLEPADMHTLTRSVMHRAAGGAEGRVVIALEGGYAPQRVGQGVRATVRGLAGLDY
jgi:acetoin utilization deacetylase AcuC-like enzyme